MLKVKDAFRRIGPSSKRKDTPALSLPSFAPAMFIIEDFTDDTSKLSTDVKPFMRTSESENCISRLDIPKLSRDSSSHSIKSLKDTKRTRKTSSQKTRSAEDLVALVNKSSEPRKLSRRSIMTQSYEPNKLLEKAIEGNYTDLVEGLITSGQVNINKLNNEGFAPLHFAASEGKSDIIKVLVDCEAYIDILTSAGHSALEIAVNGGYFECAQVLIESGADQAFVLDGPLNSRYGRECVY